MAKIGLVIRGDWRAPDAPPRHLSRLQVMIDALREVGLAAEPVVFVEERADAVRRQLAELDGVLVWVNPIEEGRDRARADALLREAAAHGTWVSAHPDVIDAMGTKEVLYRTRSLGWGSDTELYRSLNEFLARFPAKLAGGARVVKPRRGNDGRGVIKVAAAGAALRVQHASDDRTETLDLRGLAELLRPAFAEGGLVVDQQAHASQRGMVRCYMSLDRVVGFGEQQPRGDAALGMQSAKTMRDPDYAPLADLREAMESEWVRGLQRELGLTTDRLPALWDADFLFREPEAAGNHAGRFALCEINVSCVSPFPPAAPRAVAQAARRLARQASVKA